MRTTINIDDDLVKIVKQKARSRGISMGKAFSELVRRGVTVPSPTREVNGLQVFDLPEDSPRVTSKHVKDLEADER